MRDKRDDPKKINSPQVTMPSGGGALRGISEPFKAQSFTGAGGFSIPFPLPEARGLAPQINLSYSSGAGNGIFGIGFSLPLDSVARKTSTGIPRYDEQDVFILGGSELLAKFIPGEGGTWQKDEQTYTADSITWKIISYRPRIEGAFSLIQQWIDTGTQISHWKVVSSSNITSLYGVSDNGRIYDPQNPAHIFEWLIESSFDAHGNKIQYTYKAGDRIGIPETIYNAGRDFSSQRYPWLIQYGNYTMEEMGIPVEYFAFEIAFDYGQIDKDDPDAPATNWTASPDPFSTYKSGFEIRTARRCNGIYLRHLFTGENNGMPFTTTALLPRYKTESYSGLSMLEEYFIRGYRFESEKPLWKEDTPAAKITYQDFLPLNSSWQILEAEAPGYFNSSGFIPVDLDGIGIDGLLYASENFVGYLDPLGNGKFAPMRVLESFPIFRDFQSGGVSISSLEGNSVLDLVVNDTAGTGFFERADHNHWKPFQPFSKFPEEYFSPEKEMIDLNGSGKTDLVFPDHPKLKYYLSQGKLGYGDASYVSSVESFPASGQGGEEELIGFSDFFGDGLSHRFRLRNGHLEVWPNLGHGKFGAPVLFANAPLIDGLLSAKNIFLIDADGTGATDIAYLFPGFVRIWFNRNGNAFSAPIDIHLPAPYSAITDITAGDVSGYGTTSLIFTVADPVVKHFYFDFSNKQKPYLLLSMENGMGSRSDITYTSSVFEYLRDLEEGRKWVTRVPVPVHVVSESRTTDLVTEAVYTQRARYHDGYFDPVEREFRGFGFVETWDCETYEAFQVSAVLKPKLAALLDKNLWVPPVYTKSWFLTGAYELTPEICRQYSEEYFSGDAQQWSIPGFVLGPGWNEQDALAMQQAYGSMAGHTLRTEVYAEDDSPLRENPYSVSMQSLEIKLLQPRIEGKYCCVLPVPVNELTYNYDRNPADPAIAQNLVLLANEYGQTLLSASISFPRRNVAGQIIYPEQQALRCVIAQADYINQSGETNNDPATYWQIFGAGWQSRSYETGGFSAPENAPFTQEGLLPIINTAIANPISGNDSPPDSPWSRLLSWSRDYYWNDTGTEALDGGVINSLALMHHSENAVLNPEQLTRVFGDKMDTDMLEQQCGYVLLDGYWWNPGLIQDYNWNLSQFYLPSETISSVPAGNGYALNMRSSVEYDPYLLNISSSSNWYSASAALTTRYEYDYQSMEAWRSTDPNGNKTELLFDPLGKVIVSSVYGSVDTIPSGDLSVREYTIISDPAFDDVIADPAKYLQGATVYFYYDFFAWKERQQPVNSVTVTRNLHVQEIAQSGGTEDDTIMPISINYSDGLGRTLQTKAKTSPGEITLQKIKGTIINPSPENSSQERWLVSGRTVYDNKGQPVEQYQPFFSNTPYLEDQQEIIDQKLVPPPTVIHYDPAGRVIQTDSPKGFFSKVIYSPWQVSSFDFNDTILDSPYYKWFTTNYPAEPEFWQLEELNALNAALPCYNTPGIAVLDNLGNAIRSIVCNLGAIANDSIPAEIASPQTSEQAWQSLVTAGYLQIDPDNNTQAWVSQNFQPYQNGFHAIFTGQFTTKLEDYLAQSCMTSLAVYDIQGQNLYASDPRLFLKMVREEKLYFNFRNEYGMAGQVLKSESTDAGTKWGIENIFGNAVASWDSRLFQREFYYDLLQRSTGTFVSGGDGESPLSNWVQVTVYGESADDPVVHNLMGRPYEDYDESGLSKVESYSLGGKPQQGLTYLREDYKSEANWTQDAMLAITNEVSYPRVSIYNVAGAVIAESLPDETEMSYAYDINGLLLASGQKMAGDSGSWQTVIRNIVYDANGKRTREEYGNGVVSTYAYDAMTQQLVHTYTTRPATEGPERETVLQDLYYTYDPLGHTISILDQQSVVVFNNNQQVDPKSTYAYDPLYRIVESNGRTMRGLNPQDKNGAAKKSESFRPFSPVSDQQNLENYTQKFGYDFGDNLVLKRHIADSSSWSQVMRVNESSNRLDTMAVGNPSDSPGWSPVFSYDAAGNMLVLNPGSTAQVNWNYLNQMANVVTIEREIISEGETLDDAEYYQYSTSGSRVRKVTERMLNGGTQMECTEKIYLGSFQQTRTWISPVNDPVSKEILSEKKTILLQDGNTPALITHVWIQAPPSQNTIADGDTQYRYQLSDPLDSITIEVNEDADLLTFEQYYVYGGTAFILSSTQLDADSKELRFCGKERDAVTGLYYYGARYYAEWLGRWMSPDPAGPVDGPNLYEYVRSNPVNYNDPTGMGINDKHKKGKKEKKESRKRKSKTLGRSDRYGKKEKRINPKAAKEFLKRVTRSQKAPLVEASDEPQNLGKPEYLIPQNKITRIKDYQNFNIPDRTIAQSFGERFQNVYESFRKNLKFNVITSGFNIPFYYNQGAPFMRGKAVSDKYVAMLAGVKGNQTDAEVAGILLNGNYNMLGTDTQRKYASKLELTVSVAEQWRKHGALKVFTGFLGAVHNGDLTFADSQKAFQYIPAADSGRMQANLFKALCQPGNEGLAEYLPDEQKAVFKNMEDDMDTGYDTPTPAFRGEKALKGDRMYADWVTKRIDELRELKKNDETEN